MMLVLVAQLLVPLVLAALLANASGGRGALALRFAAVLLYLFAIQRLGLWTSLPGWTPWLLGLLATAATARAWTRGTPRVPRARMRRAVEAVAFTLAAIAGGFGAVEAMRARQPLPGPAVSLQWPLEQGRYRVANGGSRHIANAHLKTLDTRVPRYAAWRGQSYALDIVAVDALGLVARGWRPADPARYVIFGRRVLAPCDGRVVASGNHAPDMQVPKLDPARRLGNHVILACNGAHVLLAHLQQGSVSVAPGQSVRAGEVLGRVGNSGNSDEPHLHLHAQRPGSDATPIAAEPLPIRLAGRHLVRNDLVHAPARGRHD